MELGNALAAETKIFGRVGTGSFHSSFLFSTKDELFRNH